MTLAGTGANTLGNLRVSNGQLNLAGGTVNVTDASGSQTRVENNSTITVSSGTLNIVDGGNGWFAIGVTAGATGTVVVAGGTINIADHWGTKIGNESGFGVLTINSGSFINNDIGGIGLLFSDGASTGGTLNLNGGTLAGTATLAGALTNNAILAVGSGTLTVAGNITLNAGSTNRFAVNGTTLAKSSIAAGAAVIYGGWLNIVPSGTFTNGQQFQLFSGTGAVSASNFASLAGSPGSGLAFSFTNGVLSVVGGGPGGPGCLTNSFSGGVLSLSWPAGQNWRLQVQTNGLSSGLGTNWIYVTDGSASSTNISVNAATPAMFFRLTYP